MGKLIIEGGKRLEGTINLQGSKNSALPVLAATVAVRGVNVIHNCPRISDVSATVKILEHLGCRVKTENSTVTVDSTNINSSEIPEDIMRKMRSSIIFLGPLLSRTSKACVGFPGGCEIGLRPIDLHISAMKSLGVTVIEDSGMLRCECMKRMKAARILLAFPSVGATENIMISAATAKGTTVILNAAREPEVCDLARFLNACGARIFGAGQSTVRIEGVSELHPCEHTVIPDRIAASTYMACAAVTGGNVTIDGVIPEHLDCVIPEFEATGCDFAISKNTLNIKAPMKLKNFRKIKTMPYPGFPTDSQALIMAAASVAKGTSIFVENIFESRFRHVPELNRLGAHITVEDNRVAVVEGVSHLIGAPVAATDLRGGCALVVAGLAAQGVTTVNLTDYIDRGLEKPEIYLTALGAEIKRID